VFFVPGAMGFTFLRPAFMAGLAPDQPVYTFQLRGIDGQQPCPGSVEESAAENVAALEQAWPEGPVHLVSFCVGVQVAIEMAHRLEQQGRSPARFVLIDPRIDPLSMMVAAARRRSGGLWHAAAPERWLMLRRTGLPARLVDTDGNLTAALRERIVESARQRYAARYRRDIETASDSAAERGIEAIAQWQAHLRNHCPSPWTGPADVMFSAKRARLFADGETGLRSLLPAARIMEVGGEHMDMFDLNGTQTAQTLQALLAGQR
jgi:thioesterase domain-containing protein